MQEFTYTIGILGTGRTARAMTAYLMAQGCQVILWGRDQETLHEIREKGITASGCVAGTFYPQVEEKMDRLCQQVDYLFLMTTAAGHREIACRLRGCLKEHQRILIFNGNWGAYEFYQELKAELWEKQVIVGETGGMLFIADYEDDRCHIKSIKKVMSVAAFPCIYGETLAKELHPVLPQLIPEKNVVVTSINNSNPVIHVPLVLCNFTRVENGEDFWFYGDGATPSSIRLVEAIDRERGLAAQAAGVDFQSCLEIINSFWTEKKETLYEAMTSNQTYLSAKGPKTLKHRYLEEDLPYGIMPLLALGRAYEIPMPRMQAMVECLCCLLGENAAPKEFSLSRDDLDVLVHTLKYE